MTTSGGVRLHVNDDEVVLDVDPELPLMLALRNDLGLTGVRTGCSIGECGACTVIVDGAAVRSCITPLDTVAGARVVTPEGLGGPDSPSPVQQAFLDEQAGQCGYCVNGMIMTVASLVEAHGKDAGEAIREALPEHICRCGTHVRLQRAAERAVQAAAAGGTAGEAEGPAAPAEAAPKLSEACAGACGALESLPEPFSVYPRVQSWIRVLPDGGVEVLSGKVELGQGIRTAMSQIVASQTGLDVDRVVVRSTATDTSPDEGVTSGSHSIDHGGVDLAIAATAFRRLALQRTAERLGEPAAGLRLDAEGTVRGDSGSVSLTDLVEDGPITGRVELTDQPHWHGPPLGAPLHRPDLRTKLTGAPGYVHDLSFPGMLHARAVLPPTYEARLERLEPGPARSILGVREVVVDGRLVVAIAEREEQAVRAVARLSSSAQWDDPGLDVPDDLEAMLRALPAQEYRARVDPCVEEALDRGRRRLAATYFRPFQAHAAMAPSCAVALDDGEHLTVWTHSQGVHQLRRELAALLGDDESRIVVRHGDGPGCYGHNAADDAAALAAVAAKAVPGRHVRFAFTVDDEFAWEPYGSAMVADLEASLDEEGCILAWRHAARTDTHSSRPNGDGDRLFPSWLREAAADRPLLPPNEPGTRNAVPLYDLPDVEAVANFVDTPLRTSALRSLGAFLNVFAAESFMDELAEAAGRDPVAFRLDHLTDERARAVLEAAAEAAEWEAHVGPSGRGQGVAVCRYKDSKAYVGMVIDAEIDPEAGDITVKRVIAACDAGVVVNADGLLNQLEGGILQGLSRSLYEEVAVDAKGVHSRNWPTYPVLRFGAVPAVEIVLIDRPGCPPVGAGEVTTPPTPAALANAIDDRIGIRLRSLPFTPERTRQRLMDMTEAEIERVLL